ncbi:hypothetical protein M9Y10_039258 [Tritrichomonas musculus]|uniref:Uncharacterized protein n=1 Tax=Tritrichomonas musculus TaxID=1915356 RepID=A0ABR2KAQ0_9EUKA
MIDLSYNENDELVLKSSLNEYRKTNDLSYGENDELVLKSSLSNNNLEILTYEKEYNKDNSIFLNHIGEIANDTNVLSTNLCIHIISDFVEYNNNNKLIVKTETVDNDDIETFLQNIYIRSFDKNVLSAKLTREFVYKYVDHVMNNINIVKYDSEFRSCEYKSLNLTYFDETYDEKVLSMKSCLSMYYDLRDKLLYDKQDKLEFSSTKEHYETNKESTTIIPTLSLLNELVNDKNNDIEILKADTKYSFDNITGIDDIVAKTKELLNSVNDETVFSSKLAMFANFSYIITELNDEILIKSDNSNLSDYTDLTNIDYASSNKLKDYLHYNEDIEVRGVNDINIYSTRSIYNLIKLINYYKLDKYPLIETEEDYIENNNKHKTSLISCELLQSLLQNKQDSLTISTTKSDYETNKESTTIVPSLNLINELISECDNKNEDGSLTLNSTNDTVLSVFSNNSYVKDV